MTITPYKVDSVLKAFTKKNKIKISNTVPKENVSEEKYNKDVASLSVKEDGNAEDFNIISSNLRDVILKDNKR